MTSNSNRTIFLIWLAWAAILISFQNIATARYSPQRPDYVLYWTPGETGPQSQNNKPLLLDPFMNAQVSWDSEFYISIALNGYDDPGLRSIQAPDGTRLTLNYAFFPLYPMLMGIFTLPLRIFGLSPVATATLSGVLISLLGTLAAMLALYDLAQQELGNSGGIRAAFYLIIFPMSLFFAQVYSEGLFAGLAFSALALLKHKRWPLAALCAVLAAWTRAVGVALVIPFVLVWWNEVCDEAFSFSPSSILKGFLAVAPLIATLLWKFSFLGYANSLIEESFFSRGFFEVNRTIQAWANAFSNLPSNPQAQVYYGLEIAIMLLTLGACLATFRHNPGIALFGIAVLTISIYSGVAQSVGRYVIVVPSIYLFLSQLGENEVFDRAWTLTSILLMGMLATLFSFDMWVN